MQQRVVRQPAGGLASRRSAGPRAAGSGRDVDGALDVPQVDRPPRRPGAGRPGGRSGRTARPRSAARRGRRDVGHRVLVVQPPAGVLERRDHRQDRLAVLDGVHPPGRERVAVAQPLDARTGSAGVVARAQEVAVQGVDVPGRRRRPSSTVRPAAMTTAPAPGRRRPARAASAGCGRRRCRPPDSPKSARSPTPSTVIWAAPSSSGRGCRAGRSKGSSSAGSWGAVTYGTISVGCDDGRMTDRVSTERPYRVNVPLRWSDMDAYGHVNNVQFLRLLEDARVIGFEELVRAGPLGAGRGDPRGPPRDRVPRAAAVPRAADRRSRCGRPRSAAPASTWPTRCATAGRDDGGDGDTSTPAPRPPWSSTTSRTSTPRRMDPPCGPCSSSTRATRCRSAGARR